MYDTAGYILIQLGIFLLFAEAGWLFWLAVRHLEENPQAREVMLTKEKIASIDEKLADGPAGLCRTSAER